MPVSKKLADLVGRGWPVGEKYLKERVAEIVKLAETQGKDRFISEEALGYPWKKYTPAESEILQPLPNVPDSINLMRKEASTALAAGRKVFDFLCIKGKARGVGKNSFRWQYGAYVVNMYAAEYEIRLDPALLSLVGSFYRRTTDGGHDWFHLETFAQTFDLPEPRQRSAARTAGSCFEDWKLCKRMPQAVGVKTSGWYRLDDVGELLALQCVRPPINQYTYDKVSQGFGPERLDPELIRFMTMDHFRAEAGLPPLVDPPVEDEESEE